jgi:hypothetical protein
MSANGVTDTLRYLYTIFFPLEILIRKIFIRFYQYSFAD